MRRRDFIKPLAILATLRDSRIVQCSQETLANYPYQAAYWSASRKLTCFPFENHSHDVSVPGGFEYLFFGPDTAAIYARKITEYGRDDRRGIFKLDLVSGSPSTIFSDDSSGWWEAVLFADEKTILASGHTRSSAHDTCGLFKIVVGEMPGLIFTSKCKNSESWHTLSVSPDSTKALAVHDKCQYIIDLVTMQTSRLGSGLLRATWSPNGKWIAAASMDERHVVILDSSNLLKVKTLSAQDVKWSPDSRFLLSSRWHLLCGIYSASLEAIEVSTGRTVRLASSNCKVDSNTYGWLSRKIRE